MVEKEQEVDCIRQHKSPNKGQCMSDQFTATASWK
jgi:hypothetical protein